ncbi:hypothetical protein GGQ91_002544 [Methylobacterium fujisawaense]|uniref:Apea-like HEPN domain-containing protein n=1 Tax=Methylobacterium fujisawaense TaxID=107400 RepID=A0ABR6DAQ1_9HYPH|nr:hypothetical protein [Methylobacterium fujisawaense]MBA9063156.1 hypothetical protein [Methylobacterium fujisawaense]
MQTADSEQFVEVHAWPAEAFYWSAEPASEHDHAFLFFNFIAQSANHNSVMRSFKAIQDDYLNIAASLNKISLIHRTSSSHDGSPRLAATEVEYLLTTCRSIFDLLQEIISKFWSNVKLATEAVKKKNLPLTFSDITLHANNRRTAEEIEGKFRLPPPIAQCYVRNSAVFQRIRDFRDNIIHRGYHMQIIFWDEKEFLIEKKFGPFKDLDIWHADEVGQNQLASLSAVLNMIVQATLSACDDFALTFYQTIGFPPPTVPNMYLFMRGFHGEHITSALADAGKRILEGRSLL